MFDGWKSSKKDEGGISKGSDNPSDTVPWIQCLNCREKLRDGHLEYCSQ